MLIGEPAMVFQQLSVKAAAQPDCHRLCQQLSMVVAPAAEFFL